MVKVAYIMVNAAVHCMHCSMSVLHFLQIRGSSCQCYWQGCL